MKKEKTLKDKERLYRLLGAEHFQKVVFKVERLKYQVIDTFFPNIYTWYNKKCNHSLEKLLKKSKNDNEKERIRRIYQLEKLKFRKELVRKENRNYHINPNNPTEFMKYLKMNKEIHEKNLKVDILVLIGLVLTAISIGEVSLLLGCIMGYTLISTIIDIECINLQNYNLLRFENERLKSLLEKKEEKIRTKKMDHCLEGIKAVNHVLETTSDIPTLDEMIDGMKTKEEVKQFLALIKEELEKTSSKELETNKTKTRRI